MPTLYYRVDSPGINILKPVSDQVVYGLLDELGLVSTFKDSVYILSTFQAASQYEDPQGNPTMKKNRCDVEVTHVMDKSQVPWPVDSPYNTSAYGVRGNHRGNYAPILYDEDANILIEQQSVACSLEMAITLSFSTFDEATRAFDALQSRHKGSLVSAPYDVSFSYPVSMSLFGYLLAVKDRRVPYKDKSIVDYIDAMKVAQISFDVRTSELTKSDADVALMIRCQQKQCVARLTMDQKAIEGEKEDDIVDLYKISFTLEVQFARPAEIRVHTPISVDNTLLPYGLFENLILDRHNNPEDFGQFSDGSFTNMIQTTRGDYQNAYGLTRLPKYDTWFSVDDNYRYYEYRPVLIAHFTLDGPVTTIDLKALGEVHLHPVAQAILMEMHKRVFEYGGIFHLGVFANDLRLGNPLVTLDENLILTIHSNRPDKVYHLMLSETTMLFKMSNEWDQILLKYRHFFPLTIERNIQQLIKKGILQVSQDYGIFRLIERLSQEKLLDPLFDELIELGDAAVDIRSYTAGITQLVDYLTLTESLRDDYVIPEGSSPEALRVQEYYAQYAPLGSRSLMVAFLELCIKYDYMTLSDIPRQYLEPNPTLFPHYTSQGSYYGFNTPLRVINYTIGSA